MKLRRLKLGTAPNVAYVHPDRDCLAMPHQLNRWPNWAKTSAAKPPLESPEISPLPSPTPLVIVPYEVDHVMTKMEGHDIPGDYHAGSPKQYKQW